MNKFFEKTIEHIISYINEAIFYEKYSKANGLLQSIEPRIKIISLLLLVFFTLTIKDLKILIILNFFAILLAYVSKIPIKDYLFRIYIFIPIFAALIALPTIFFIPGEPIIKILFLTITDKGLLYFITFVLRVATCISYSILIPLTTPWNIVLSSLKMFKIPDEIITLFNLTYRYIFLLLNQTLEILHSRKSRTIKKLGILESWKEAAKIISFTFIKVNFMGEELYYSIQSRGSLFSIYTRYNYKIKFIDILFFLLIILIIIILWWGHENII
ncbi:cobalt ABC transporter, inner membrane subunit CbiQ [Methanocaldococcus infernus ME]|uniref:Cobalt ABC transporter, inner membrane subunit CbiQ n=1 Tax=Methanocaldococcus infernus (strain DSM 11812 / JCM 15783 / ME) TaxID=573063 RepID=D5VQX6_METIM|nr:cobalt ECF transporter T component CbiQ [Methanocaldococcus infernus]ADG12979.1 cobalt ABC transporter, inner membrane subunit CbiQ [Methanocaldococcus infernus ME]